MECWSIGVKTRHSTTPILHHSNRLSFSQAQTPARRLTDLNAAVFYVCANRRITLYCLELADLSFIVDLRK